MDPNPTTCLSLLPKVSSHSFFFEGLSLKYVSFKMKVQPCVIAMSFNLYHLFPFPFFSPYNLVVEDPQSFNLCGSHTLDFADLQSYDVVTHVSWFSVFLGIDSHIQSPGHIQFCLFVWGKPIGGMCSFIRKHIMSNYLCGFLCMMLLTVGY